MKELSVSRITEAVAKLSIQANRVLPDALVGTLSQAAQTETDPLGRSILKDLQTNIAVAKEKAIPVCQDTGMAVVFLEVGQDLHLTGGPLEAAVQAGVRKGYLEGLLRLSVVSDPLERVNSGDNTPAVIHTRIVDGEQIRITVAPKGFGSENMSGIRMLTPAAGRQGVVDAVLEIVRQAGSNPCPPMVVGVGIGGDFEQCALLAKIALCRDVSVRNADPVYAALEAELLSKINELGIGPQGFGGATTALAVNIEQAATHIAGLPVAVNIGCHVTRHASIVLEGN